MPDHTNCHKEHKLKLVAELHPMYIIARHCPDGLVRYFTGEVEDDKIAIPCDEPGIKDAYKFESEYKALENLQDAYLNCPTLISQFSDSVFEIKTIARVQTYQVRGK